MISDRFLNMKTHAWCFLCERVVADRGGREPFVKVWNERQAAFRVVWHAVARRWAFERRCWVQKQKQQQCKRRKEMRGGERECGGSGGGGVSLASCSYFDRCLHDANV